MNYNKAMSETSVRIYGRASYENLLHQGKAQDGSEGKYGVQMIIPKDPATKKLIETAMENAKKAAIAEKWGGKAPGRLAPSVLRDGDVEKADDANYEDMYFMNCSSKNKPGVKILENGKMVDPLDDSEIYSGCWGCAVINFYGYDVSGNKGIAAGINNFIKIKDDERLGGGGRTAEQDFGDLVDTSFLD